MVRDRIVFGIRNTELKDRLINVDNLTLDKAEEMCRTSEVTKKELREMVSTTEAADIQAIKNKYRKQVQKPRQQENSYEVNGYKGNSIKKQYGKNNNYNYNSKDNVKFNNDQEYLCKKCNKKHFRKNCPAYG